MVHLRLQGYESPSRQELKSLPLIWLQQEPSNDFLPFPFFPVSLQVACCQFRLQAKAGDVHLPMYAERLAMGKLGM